MDFVRKNRITVRIGGGGHFLSQNTVEKRCRKFDQGAIGWPMEPDEGLLWKQVVLTPILRKALGCD